MTMQALHYTSLAILLATAASLRMSKLESPVVVRDDDVDNYLQYNHAHDEATNTLDDGEGEQITVLHRDKLYTHNKEQFFRSEHRRTWDPPSSTVFTTNKLPDLPYMPTVGNGHIATVIKGYNIFMNGVYNGAKGDSSRAEIPSPACFNIDVQSETGYDPKMHYEMDVGNGTFREYYTARDYYIRVRYFAHRTITRVIVAEIDVTTTPELKLNFVSCMGGSDDIDFREGPSGAEKLKYIYGKAKVPEYPDLADTYPFVHMFYDVLPEQVTVPRGQHVRIVLLTAASVDKQDAYSAYQKAQALATQGDELYRGHAAAWQGVWQRGRIDVTGDSFLAKAIYGCWYYQISSLPLVNDTVWPFFGMSPGGLAHGDGNDYLGHVFWDQDLWMYPAILAFHPDLAREILRMRVNKLSGARYNAASHGYKGAMFPWESAFSGRETTPGEIYADYEIHISGDTALAARNYFYMANDSHFFEEEGGRELVQDIAEFWASKATYNQRLDRYDIFNVMPPDEWHAPVNNSAFTNAVAAMALSLPFDIQRASGVKFTNATEYDTMGRKVFVPYDSQHDYHPEYEGYTLGTQVKQADAILLQFPLLWPMKDSTRLTDARIYEQYTTQSGPAMTWGIFSICWLALGQPDHAADLFARNFHNIMPPFYTWSEYPGGSGAVNFATGMGNFLQNLVFGYAGLRLTASHLELSPALPPNVTDITYTGITYLSTELQLSVTADAMTVVALTADRQVRLCLQVAATGDVTTLLQDKPVTMPRQKVTIARC